MSRPEGTLNYTEIEKNLIRRLHTEGVHPRDIGERIGRPERSIRVWLSRHHLVKRQPAAVEIVAMRLPVDDYDRLLAECFLANMTISEYLRRLVQEHVNGASENPAHSKI